MTLTSATKFVFILFFSLCSTVVFSQVEDIEKESEADTKDSANKILNYGVRGALGASYNLVNTLGDKYVGLGYTGNGGFGFQFKLFVFDGFYAGGKLSFSFFENKDITITGNYDKTRVSSSYLFLGYEYRITDKVSIGVNSSIFGQSFFRNRFFKPERSKQFDSANIRALEAHLDYFVDPNFSINVFYIHRNDKTNIRTSTNLQSRFDRAQFSIIGIGFNFQFGSEGMLSSLKNKK